MALSSRIWTQQVQQSCWKHNLGKIGSSEGQFHGPKHHCMLCLKVSLQQQQIEQQRLRLLSTWMEIFQGQQG